MNETINFLFCTWGVNLLDGPSSIPNHSSSFDGIFFIIFE